MEKNFKRRREKISARKVVRISAGKKSVVLGVTGSIAAYKSAELAMNGKMWQHPTTQENVEKLKARGVEFIGPEEGMLACGYEGLGRLWKVNDIAFRAEFLLARQEDLIA